MNEMTEQQVLDFYIYPALGKEDWRYTFATAKVRVLQSQMLSKAMLHDMANAADFAQAVELLSSTEYALSQGSKDFAEAQQLLLERRSEVRDLSVDLIIDKPIAGLLRAREDFRNLRLALRRKLTDRPLGTDYSNDGVVAAEEFEQIFEEENYSPLPYHLQEAIEAAVLGYYQNKDVRQIDYAIDRYEAMHGVRTAKTIGSEFVEGLFRMRVDLTNIRTMFRLKLSEAEERNVFIDGGYVELEKFKHGLDTGYESLGALFFATPYQQIIEGAATYFMSEKSFLRLEQLCEAHLNGYLESTIDIAAGPQPVIAYLLLKESEIRKVRLILTAKKNLLDAKLILDRLGR